MIPEITSQILCEPFHFQSGNKQLVHQPAMPLSEQLNVFEYSADSLKRRFLLRERDPSKSFSFRVKNDRETIGWKGSCLPPDKAESQGRYPKAEAHRGSGKKSALEGKGNRGMEPFPIPREKGSGLISVSFQSAGMTGFSNPHAYNRRKNNVNIQSVGFISF